MTVYPQFCALARAAEVVGERWTLLIFRELLLGPKRFTNLSARLAPVTPAVLNARLRRLEEYGLVERDGAAGRARGYALTPAGQALRPAMRELVRWGARFLLPPRPGEVFEPEWLQLALGAFARSDPRPPAVIHLVVREGGRDAEVWVRTDAAGTHVGGTALPADATVRMQGMLTLLAVATRQLPVADAVAAGAVEVEGDTAVAAALPDLFDPPV